MPSRHMRKVRTMLSSSGYSDEQMPLRSYGALVGLFTSAVGAGVASAARRGVLPDHLSAGDVVLMGLATHKLSRLVSRDTVTSWLRSPFTRYAGPGGANELDEQARGEGMQRAVGELLICPPCTGQWLAGGLVLGLFHAPRLARGTAAIFAVQALSDFLHGAYASLPARA